MSGARTHPEMLALHFGAPAPVVGEPISALLIAAPSFHTASGTVGQGLFGGAARMHRSGGRRGHRHIGGCSPRGRIHRIDRA